MYLLSIGVSAVYTPNEEALRRLHVRERRAREAGVRSERHRDGEEGRLSGRSSGMNLVF